MSPVISVIFIFDGFEVLNIDIKKPRNIDHISCWENIDITNFDQKKCIRCWNKSASVGSIAEDPEICNRCNTNVYGDGEVRKFV